MDLRYSRVAGVFFDLQDHCLVDVAGAANQHVARLPRHWQGLTGQQRFVEGASAIDQTAVSWDDLARVHAHPVAGRQVGDQHLLLTVRIQSRGEPGQDLADPVERIGRAHPTAQFDAAGKQNQEHEHGDRVVVHLARLRPGGVQAAQIRKAQSQYDRHVHAEPAVAQVAPCADEKFLPRIGQQRGSGEKAGPAPYPNPQGQLAGLVAQPHDVAGDGEVHHHHADHAGEDEAFDTALFLDPVEFLASRRVVGVRDIADAEDAFEDLAELDASRIPAHPCMMAGIVEIDLDDAVEPAQHALVEPQAGGATNILQQQRSLAGVFRAAHERFLHRGVVVETQLADDLRHHVGSNRFFASVLVVFLEAGIDDAACHRQAAVAAERTRPARDRYAFVKVRVERKSAVKAAFGDG